MSEQQPLLETLAPVVTPRTDWASAIVDNADRLGLKWQLRYGTITTPHSLDANINNAGSNNLTIILDGDTAPISATPLAGINPDGARVAVIQAPPSGNYVIGSVVPQSGANQLIWRIIAASSGGITGISNVLTAVPGMSATPTVTGNFDWECEAFFDFNVTTGGATTVFGQLVGPNGTEAAIPIFGIPTTGLRSVVGMVWSGSNSSSPSFAFNVRKSAALGAVDLVAARAIIRIYQ